jgi:hypothetical protein
MLRTTFFVRIIILAAIIFVTACFYTVVSAQQQAGVRISPALIEESLDPGIEKDYTLIIENQEQSERKFYLSSRNISDVTETGNPIFAKDPNEVTGMELASWIELSQSEITLGANQRAEVAFKMRLPQDASPGSHFGGIFISIDPPDIENSGAAVSYQVANIISIFVSGEVDENANIRQFSTDKYFYGSKDVDFNIRIENPGNVLVRPIGPLEIHNMLGQQVGTFIFNESEAAVFPGKTREYVFDWKGDGVGFGRYEAVLSAVYGEYGGKKTISSSVSFWILPMSIIGPALGVLAVILLITFLIVRIYINRTLAKMSYGNTRLVRSRRRQGPSPILLLVLVMLMVTALFMIVLLALFA